MSIIQLKFPSPIIRNIFCFLLLTWIHSFGQELVLNCEENIPFVIQKQLAPKTFFPKNKIKLSQDFNAIDWRAVIDSTWGEGLPTEQKLQIFDTFWDTIDREFACFQDLNVNWDSLRVFYRAEVANGVSKGRFAGIMNHLALSLRESHTHIDDILVNWRTAAGPGVPLLFVGGWGDNGHFGAGLTPLPDSSLLVYKTVPSHPLGLTPGDIVLGYNGTPWKHLYPELLKAQLPMTGFWWGCSESAYVHSWLMSAGLNWHLFDIIDIVKFESGDTIHLSTELLQNKSMSIFCSEQLEIPGVHMRDMDEALHGKVVSSGIVEGTHIGYIYVWGWYSNVEDEFFKAVDSLMNKITTTGLIIDFRTNFGGNMFLSDKALELLFKSSVSTIGFAMRSNPYDHFAMESAAPPSEYVIHGNRRSYYDKPIAVLTGPGARSSGDQVALRMKFHPRVRVFGKSTTASFNAPMTMKLGISGWYAVYAYADAYLVSNPDHYLTHDEFDVDEKAWLTPEDVAQGRDTVVEAAIRWINDTAIDISDQDFSKRPLTFSLHQNFPNPFNFSTTISYDLPQSVRVDMAIYNVLGEKIRQLVCKRKAVGHHEITWNGQDDEGTNVTSGLYLCRITAGEFEKTRKLILME